MALFVRRRWPKVLAALAAVAVLVVAVVVLTRPSHDAAPPPFGAPLQTSEPPGPVDTPSPTPAVPLGALLTASDPELRTYADQAVSADGVRVYAPVGPSAAWVGSSAAERLLVVLVGADTPFRVSSGTRLTFDGFVRTADASAAKVFGLHGADAAELARQGVYVEVAAYRTT
jgi:hypothetical protein